MGCWAPALVWKPSWKFPLKFAGSSQTPQPNWGLMSYHTPNSSRMCSGSHLSPKGRWNRLAQVPHQPQWHKVTGNQPSGELWSPAQQWNQLCLVYSQAKPQCLSHTQPMITGTPSELTPSVICTQFTYWWNYTGNVLRRKSKLQAILKQRSVAE